MRLIRIDNKLKKYFFNFGSRIFENFQKGISRLVVGASSRSTLKNQNFKKKSFFLYDLHLNSYPWNLIFRKCFEIFDFSFFFGMKSEITNSGPLIKVY